MEKKERMYWYRAEIRGAGYYIDSGAHLPETKVVHYDFHARNAKEARKKAKEFAHSSEIRREFWMTDLNPQITVMRILNSAKPLQERAYLAN